MQRTISIISTKGGVGKTTAAANIAGYLSQSKHTVLMIDADPQPSLSSYYELTYQALGGLTEVLVNPKSINDNISQTRFGDIIYSNDNKNQIQHWLTSEADGRYRLRYAISQLKKQYDYIIIDTQGAKGSLQDAAVIAADTLLTPMLAEMTTVQAFQHGTLEMVRSLQSLSNMTAGLKIPKLSIVIYKLDARTVDAKQFIQYLLKLANNPKSGLILLNTKIPNSVVFKDAASQRVPVVEFANCNKKQQGKAQKSVVAIRELVEELKL